MGWCPLAPIAHTTLLHSSFQQTADAIIAGKPGPYLNLVIVDPSSTGRIESPVTDLAWFAGTFAGSEHLYLINNLAIHYYRTIFRFPDFAYRLRADEAGKMLQVSIPSNMASMSRVTDPLSSSLRI